MDPVGWGLSALGILVSIGIWRWDAHRRTAKTSNKVAAPVNAPQGHVNQFPQANIGQVLIHQAPYNPLPAPIPQPAPARPRAVPAAPRPAAIPVQPRPNVQLRGTSIRYVTDDEQGSLVETNPEMGMHAAVATFWNAPRDGQHIETADYVRANIRYTSLEGILLVDIDYAPWLSIEYNFTEMHVGDFRHLVVAAINHDGRLTAIGDTRSDYQHLQDGLQLRPLPEGTRRCIATVHLTGNRGLLTIQRRFTIALEGDRTLTIAELVD